MEPKPSQATGKTIDIRRHRICDSYQSSKSGGGEASKGTGYETLVKPGSPTQNATSSSATTNASNATGASNASNAGGPSVTLSIPSGASTQGNPSYRASKIDREEG